MKRVEFNSSWPESVKLSHLYDALEFWGDRSNLGYTYAYKRRFDTAIRLVGQAAAPPARVLDLAAAQGNFTLKLAELGYDVVWNDLRGELVDYVRMKYEFGSVNYLPGNIFEIAPEKIGRFDVILATEIIEHVAHPDQFLTKLASLLNDNGTIVLTTPNGSYFRNRLPRFSDCPDPSVFETVQFRPNSDGHIFLLHPDELAAIARQAGLQVKQLVLFTNPLTNGHVKTGRLLRALPKRVVDICERLTRLLPVRAQRSLNVHMASALSRVAE